MPNDPRRSLLAAILLPLLALPGLADDLGQLNPEEGGISHLAEVLAGDPDKAGIACWIAYETQKGGLHTQAISAMTLCAESGNAPSMILLAHAYENGLGVAPDEEHATLWFKRAAAQGYSVGQYHYGMALLEGAGVPRDEGQARFWLMQAAKGGDADAARVLDSWPMS